LVLKDSRDFLIKEFRVLKDSRVFREDKVHKVHKVLKDSRVFREYKVLKEFKDSRVFRVFREDKVLKEFKDSRDFLIKEFRVFKVLLVQVEVVVELKLKMREV
jgi:hypothetical protein